MIRQLFQEQLSIRDLDVGVIHDKQLVQNLVRDWHSVLDEPQGWKVAFLLSCGNTIVGVATWGRPVARLEDQTSTLENTRFALNALAPWNSGTKGLALMRCWIREHMPEVTRLITYQDCDHHDGGIYKGDNWLRVYDAREESASWTNRPGRIGDERKRRSKWERKP